MKNKLNITGIVVEYNPFHNGHLHHLQEARKKTHADVLVCVMSTHFVQRGEPAIIDKWQRTQIALENGVDIVLELPTLYVLQSADYFAKAAIEILAKVGVSDLVFGSETHDIQKIKDNFNFRYEKGKSYAAQMAKTSEPNDILSYQYVMQCEKHGIIPHSIQRTNRYHSTEMDQEHASASAIRKAYFNGEDFSKFTPTTIKHPHHLTLFEKLIQYSLEVQDSSAMESILLVDEGIQNLLRSKRALPLERILEETVSKRYTRSRIQRTLCNIMLQNKKDELQEIQHARVLGMTQKGQAYLKELEYGIDYVTRFKDYQFKDSEERASFIYSLFDDEAYQQTLRKKERTAPIIL